MEKLYKDHGSEGLFAITMMTQAADNTEATPEVAERWVSTHGITHPVVTAPMSASNVSDYFTMQWFPQQKLLAPGMRVAVDGGATEIIQIEPWDLAGALEGSD